MDRPRTPEPGQHESEDEGPFDQSAREAPDPVGGTASPGSDQMMPPTGDVEDPTPEHQPREDAPA